MNRIILCFILLSVSSLSLSAQDKFEAIITFAEEREYGMLKYTSLKDDFQLFLCKKDSTDGIGPFLIELKPMNNVVLIPCNFNQADYLIFRYKKWYMYWTLTDKDFSFRKYYFSLTFDKKPLHSGNLFSINKYTSRDINHIHYVYKWGISSDETSGGEERSYIGNRCLYNKEIKDIIRSLR